MTGVPTVTLRTVAPDETRAVAAAAAPLLRAGDVVALSGELGAGKTCFVQGAASGLGLTDRVTSPTFMLVKTYTAGRLPVVHVDVYRLNRLQDVLDLGDDVFAPDAVTFVEWGDAVTSLLPDDHLDIEIVHAGDPDDVERRIRLQGHGSWAPRMEALATACAAWKDA